MATDGGARAVATGRDAGMRVALQPGEVDALARGFEEELNTETAAAPEAIRSWPPPKLPLGDNDPTRDIPPRRGAESVLLLVVSAVALAVLFVASALTLLQG